MPFRHSQEQIKADAAMAAGGKCPECYREVDPATAEAHARDHWPHYDDLKPDTDAARRARLVMSIGHAQGDK